MDDRVKKIWEKAVDFHGHECGGLALGVRAAIEAQSRFNLEKAADEEIVCVTENDACGVDGIQVILGCTMGKGNLLYLDRGKFAYNFFMRETGESFRLIAREKREDLHGADYIEHVLSAPLDDVFLVGDARIDMPGRARSLRSVKCELCGEETAESRIRLRDGRHLCLDCCDEYERA